MFIDDGRGKGIQAEVTSDNKLKVYSATNPLFSGASLERGTLFRWISSYAATAGDFVLYVKNDDQANNLRMNRLIVGSSVAVIWTTYRITGGTPAGTALTALNMNFSSGKVPTATAYGNAAVTGSPTGTITGYIMTGSGVSGQSLIEGALVMPVNTAWALKVSATGTVYCVVEGWFEAI